MSIVTEPSSTVRTVIWDSRFTITKKIHDGVISTHDNSQRHRFHDAYTRQLEIVETWADIEILCDLWHHVLAETEIRFFKDRYNRVIQTKFEVLKKVARIIMQRSANIVSHWNLGITKAVVEGINIKTTAVKQRVGHPRDRENFKTATTFLAVALISTSYNGGVASAVTICECVARDTHWRIWWR